MRRLLLAAVILAPAALVMSAGLGGAASLRRPAITPIVGAYYFDGWAAPPSEPPCGVPPPPAGCNRWLAGLAAGPFSDRRPLFGWYDNSDAVMRRQLAWARSAGIGFFAFDWYDQPGRLGWPTLNDAVARYLQLPAHDGVRFALDFIDNATPVTHPSAWRRLTAMWVSRFFSNPDYLRVDGKPLLIINDAQSFADSFHARNGAALAAGFLAELRHAAMAHGLRGVFVIAGTRGDARHPGIAGQGASDWTQGVPYDAVGTYGDVYAFADGTVPVAAGHAYPYSLLTAATRSIWHTYAARSPLRYVPTVEAGWDPRPWRERPGGKLFWFTRTPGAFASAATQGLAWLADNPTHRVEARPRRPLMMIQAWNELGEGAYVLPTVGTGLTYVHALARAIRCFRAPAAAGCHG